MNYRALFLILFTLEHVYRLALHVIQARSAGNPTPASVADVYDAETYQRWKKYSGEKCRLQVLGSFISWAVTFALLLTNAHAAAAALVGGGIYVQMIAVLVFQALVETVFGAITGYVDTMVIEQKYGFNRSTIKTFVMDQLRNFLIEALLSIVLMAVLAQFWQPSMDTVLSSSDTVKLSLSSSSALVMRSTHLLQCISGTSRIII